MSKKDKQQEKSNTFAQKIEVNLNTSGGISKSALRRRKRKAKEELKPKMNELLMSLDEPTNKNVKIVEKAEFIESSKAKKNLPNAAKRTGHSKILSQENKNFNSVLQNPGFRASPFNALKEAIAQNLGK